MFGRIRKSVSEGQDEFTTEIMFFRTGKFHEQIELAKPLWFESSRCGQSRLRLSFQLIQYRHPDSLPLAEHVKRSG